MQLAVLLVGTANPATLRALPHGLQAVHTDAAAALDAARALACERLLIVEPEARVSAETFAAAQSVETDDGLVGGCASTGGMLRFGSVFSSVPFGPYPVEPFPLVDLSGGVQRERPAPDAIDVVAPGLFLVDRRAFIDDAHGFDPILGAPWRAYDLSLRFREAGRAVRWDSRLAFVLDSGLTQPENAADHRDFMRAWAGRMTSRFDRDMPARGGIRRPLRLPLGQREAIAVPLPPVDVVLYGRGGLTGADLRAATRVRLSSLRDVRGDADGALMVLRESLESRSDRYVMFVDAAHQPDARWLERMLTQVEWSANVCAVCEPGRTVLSLGKIPLDVQPPTDAETVERALDAILDAAQQRARIVRGRPPLRATMRKTRPHVSVVIVAHSLIEYGRTSFEGIYAGDLGVDYFGVATPARPKMLDFLKGYPTIQRIVDDSRGLAAGVNAALARAGGEIVAIIGDEFFPPRGWIEMVRDAFAVRPETGILGFSSVLVDGPQCVDAGYGDIKAFHAYAGQRRATMRREAHLAHRLAALALAIDARALRAVGGFDPRLGAGRWGIEDLTIRLRAAGYEAYVSEDIFAHHFPPAESQPLLSDPEDESRRALAFAEKWGLQPSDLAQFNPMPFVARGFDRARDFVPLHDLHESGRQLRERYAAVFIASCGGTADLDAISAAVRRYFSAFKADEEVLFAIAVGEGLEIEAVSARVRASARKAKVALDAAPDVVISALGAEPERWLEGVASGPRYVVHDAGHFPAMARLEDLSPSGFRRARVSVPA